MIELSDFDEFAAQFPDEKARLSLRVDSPQWRPPDRIGEHASPT
jgi:hypothetical protein